MCVGWIVFLITNRPLIITNGPVLEKGLGLRNQLLEQVNAIQFSLLTGRILIIKASYVDWHQNMKYDSLDSVIK